MEKVVRYKRGAYTVTRSAAVRKPLADVIHDPSRSAAAPPIPFQAAKPHVVENRLLDVLVEQGSSTEPLTGYSLEFRTHHPLRNSNPYPP